MQLFSSLHNYPDKKPPSTTLMLFCIVTTTILLSLERDCLEGIIQRCYFMQFINCIHFCNDSKPQFISTVELVCCFYYLYQVQDGKWETSYCMSCFECLWLHSFLDKCRPAGNLLNYLLQDRSKHASNTEENTFLCCSWKIFSITDSTASLSSRFHCFTMLLLRCI